ncbi:MAG: CPBP family glutamic-type intramembrane protease [Thermosynechococcaceae cyanobacterium]
MSAGGAAPLPTSLLGLFLRFVQRPFYSQQPIASRHTWAKVGDILRLYSLALTILLPLLFIISTATASLGAKSHPINELFKTMPLYAIGFFAVVMAPLLEEFIFRLPLRYSPLNVALPLALIAFLIPVETFVFVPGATALRLVSAVVVGLGFYVWLHRRGQAKGHSFYAKYTVWIVYASAILFGAMHIFNFDPKTYWIAPLVVMPQFTIGMFLSFIRLRHGFGWAIFTHGFHNFCALLPYALTQLGSQQLREKGFSGAKDVVLPTSDYILLGLVVLFVGGGLFLAVRSVIKMVREWRLERRTTQQS